MIFARANGEEENNVIILVRAKIFPESNVLNIEVMNNQRYMHRHTGMEDS
jgi:hypothetical protein